MIQKHTNCIIVFFLTDKMKIQNSDLFPFHVILKMNSAKRHFNKCTNIRCFYYILISLIYTYCCIDCRLSLTS